jgi:hypothetical protein
MTPKTVGGLLIAGLIIAFCLLAGCTNDLKQNTENTCAIDKYGNGVYYFGCTEANFATELSTFIGEHKDIRVVTVAVVTSPAGYNDPIKGYFVITEPKE